MTLHKLTNFKNIVEANLEHVNFAIGEHAETDKVRIGKAANAVIARLQRALNPEEIEQVVPFIEKLKLIDKQFEEAGQGTVFASSIRALSLLHSLRSSLEPTRQEITEEPFILELKVLIEAPEIGDKQSAAKKLYNFQKNVLLPTLQSIQNLKELLALESIVDDCNLLCDKLESIDTNSHLSNQRSTLLSLWNFQACKTDPLYVFLTSYCQGTIPGLSDDKKRELVARKLANFIENFIKHIDNPAISPKDKTSIYNALKTIQIEFEEFTDGKEITTILQKLSKVLEIPVPSANVSQLLYQFDQSSSSMASSLPNRVKTIEDRILENISSLDVNSPQLPKKIKLIKTDISKRIDIDFSALEAVLDLLLDPKILQISEEESRFVELLLLKTCNSKADLDKYSNLNEQSVRDARHFLVKNLKLHAGSLEELLKFASVAKEKIKHQTIKDRFDRFAEFHNFPAFTQHFASHFPILVRNFEAFTREVAAKELEMKWRAIAKMIDDQCDAKFSALLQNYSYLDPRPQFEEFIRASQEEYFECLPLDKIDKARKEKLIENLEIILNKNKDVSCELFQDNYMEMYSDMHRWLFQNIHAIKVPFNQGDDIHKNLGNGVCYNNCLYRMTQIQKNPKIAPSKVLMGSNEKTRFCHSKVKAYYDAAMAGKISYQDADDEQTKVAGEYGLQKWHQYPLVTPLNTDPHEFLVDEMARYAKAGHTKFIMNLYKLKAGHAVNIQIDFANGVYRLYDDNIGLCEYKDLSQFKIQVAKYFKIAYPEFNSYQFRLFKKI